MAKDQKIDVMWKLLFGTVTCLSFALPALSDSSKQTCPAEFSKQSTIPPCKMVRLPDGTMVQTVPKHFSPPAVVAGKLPGKHTICRIPDCGKNLCKNGCCEETMVGYHCHCSRGFQGRHCDEPSTTGATTKPTASPTKTMSERLDPTTSQSTTTSKSVTAKARTKSEPSPTATTTERSDATTSQETPTSKSVESSTTDATTKGTMSPTTTVSDTTTSQDTTTSKSVESSATDATTKATTSPRTTMSDTTTSQETTASESVTAEARTKSESSPTTTMTERSEATTSQETPTSSKRNIKDVSESVESSTTDATTKATTCPRTTMSDTTTSQETTASACSSPPMEYEYGRSFYNFSTCRINQASAVLACCQYGSHLVFIESQEEEDFIARSLLHRWDYWIGLTGSSLSEAKWLDGSSLTYSNFDSESFNDKENCFRIKVWYQSMAGRLDIWQDKDCSKQLKFICEKEVGI